MSDIKFTVVIPARYGSTRLPAKALADIAGVPMVCRVAQTAQASGAGRVIVACDDERILDACGAHGVRAELTCKDHPSGTDRVLEVALGLALSDEEILINVQGDEPCMPSVAIRFLAERMQEGQLARATLMQEISDESELLNANIVKMVVDRHHRAMYFSRSPLPFGRNPVPDGFRHWRHIGIYGYRIAALKDFVALPSSALERIEALEQLRLLENGRSIHAFESPEPVPPGIDTPEDLEAVRRRLGSPIRTPT